MNNRYFTLNANIHFFILYLAHFFLESEMLRTKIVEKNQNTHFVFSNFFLQKILPFMR